VGLHRDADFHVAQDPGLAGKTKTLAVLFPGNLWGRRALNLSFFDLHPAFPAESLSAAGSLDIHSRFHGRLEQVFPRRDLDFPVVGLEPDDYGFR
jgi:hypothetical protein